MAWVHDVLTRMCGDVTVYDFMIVIALYINTVKRVEYAPTRLLLKLFILRKEQKWNYLNFFEGSS